MPKCLQCGNSVIVVKNLKFELSIKKQAIEVIVPCNVCQNCNANLMNNDQMNHLRRAGADRFRQLNHLLSSKEIIEYREKLGLSQIGFAHFLNVGPASIKRWETYYIQDESQDDHIRLKCDPLYAESNYFYLQSKYAIVDIYCGFKTFSEYLVEQVSKYFEKLHFESPVYLSRFHFYTDFLHFKRHNRCITGLRYIPVKSGPAPYNYNKLMHFSEQLDSYKNLNLDDDEKQTVEDVCDLFSKNYGEKMCDLSSKEKGFLETHETEFISYDYAKDLLI